ncbi:Tn7-like element transposition protein TnsE [Psychrobacter sp. I-STPA6b]|uniref:Tn7-like element transposition protein TnsE n=1 Tax=Psychrobacter sp. I-STPA6b TaxID=2585718 RepID=UPI001D0CCC91|nr:Tn7-like element transposition protein TnsE [Psychrobacter sp. I-STPA6b]
MKVEYYPENSQIWYVAHLFKFHNLKTWNIDLCIKSGQQEQVLHTRLSNLPAIAKRRFINPTDGQARKAGYPFNLKNISTSNWQVGTDLESGGNTFVFDYIQFNDTTITIHIPQIEFARVLFFHNAYLARNCIDQSILSREFWIQEVQKNSILVNILPTNSLSLKTFESESQRRLLAWVLIDDNARASYESIAKNFIKGVKQTQDKKMWCFSFNPPNLEDISLETTGWLDKKTNNYYVYEILGISNIPSSLSQKVQFYSDKFKVGKKGSTKSNSAKPIGSKDSDTIDDQQEPNIDTKLKKIEIPTTSFSFANAIETRKVIKKRVSGTKGLEAEEYEELVELDLSADEAIVDGTACQADFSGLDDDSDVLELYMQRFEAFKLLIKRLSKHPAIECTERLHFLPAVGRSRLHRTIDGNKRSILEVRVKTDTSQFVILEIDTSDNSKPVSTLIIKVDDINTWNEHIDEVLKIIVKRSLRWPKINYLKKFGTVRTLNHPQGILELTEDSEEIISWQHRLNQALSIV